MIELNRIRLVLPRELPSRCTHWVPPGTSDTSGVTVHRSAGGSGRSPNTVKAYAHDLKDYWCFTGFRGLDWREARLEDVGEFVASLQLPPAGRSGAVSVLPSATAEVSASTVNRKPRGGQRVLCAPGPQRRRSWRPAGRVEDRWAGRVEAVSASCEQGEA
ncbi:MAG: site-specific integrase, partial [Streptosporangiaceae bacterium]